MPQKFSFIYHSSLSDIPTVFIAKWPSWIFSVVNKMIKEQNMIVFPGSKTKYKLKNTSWKGKPWSCPCIKTIFPKYLCKRIYKWPFINKCSVIANHEHSLKSTINYTKQCSIFLFWMIILTLKFNKFTDLILMKIIHIFYKQHSY